MPAEWAPHQCTWISWPHRQETWPGKFEPVEPLMARFVGAMSASELVRINVLDAAHEQRVRGFLEGQADARNVRFHHFATDDAWCRDHGAIFATREHAQEPLLALDFQFNAWGRKYPAWELDDGIPRQMAKALDVPRYAVDMVLEGGSIEVNGAGTVLTTEACLLNPNRNPSLSREQIEAALKATLGVHQVLWLGDGIVGDDTDGHIDDLTRFVAEDTVVTMVESDCHDDNYAALSANRERLDSLRLADGRPLKVVELAMPHPVVFRDERLPASHANFLICNRTVIVPVFNDPADAPNLAKIASLFPGRTVTGIDCTDLVLGHGTFHCLSQQVPAPRAGQSAA
jgi:agmatine deiminase